MPASRPPRHPHLLRILRPAARPARRVALLALVALLAAALGAPGPAAALGHSPVLDPFPGYEPQTTCASAPQPGTVALSRYLMRTYPGTGSLGLLRDCAAGGSSEHKDGRAFDWAADVDVPDQRAAAEDFIAAAFAPDAAGNPDVLARRLGIMYLIYDDTIYSSYYGYQPRPYLNAGCVSLARCSRDLRHLNHVHISLSLAGAAAQTSWYRNRGVPSVPVLVPGTRQLDPERTAVTSLEVPADGESVTTDFTFTAGVTYRLVATGLIRYGGGEEIGDANCTFNHRQQEFVPTVRQDPASTGPAAQAPTALPASRGLLLGTRLPWGPDCSQEHTYETLYTPRTTHVARLTVADPHPAGNDGTLTVHVARADITSASLRRRYPAPGRAEPRPWTRPGAPAPRLRAETVQLDTAAATGTRTRAALVAGRRYRVVVAGTAHDASTPFDASCVAYRHRWWAQHTVDLRDPAADHLGVYLDGVKVPLRPAVPGADVQSCTGEHRYRAVLAAPVSGRARLAVWDPRDYTDNTGAFTVTLRRLPGRGPA